MSPAASEVVLFASDWLVLPSQANTTSTCSRYACGSGSGSEFQGPHGQRRSFLSHLDRFFLVSVRLTRLKMLEFVRPLVPVTSLKCCS